MAAPIAFSNNRYVRDATQVESYPAASGYQINVGDLVTISGGLCQAVQYMNGVAWNSGNEIQNWSGARSQFLGVATSQFNSTSILSGSVRVILDGVFTYPLPGISSGAQLYPGTFVSFTQLNPSVSGATAGSGYFYPQALMQCSGAATCIGKILDVSIPAFSGLAQANVQLQSTVALGTINNT